MEGAGLEFNGLGRRIAGVDTEHGGGFGHAESGEDTSFASTGKGDTPVVGWVSSGKVMGQELQSGPVILGLLQQSSREGH